MSFFIMMKTLSSLYIPRALAYYFLKRRESTREENAAPLRSHHQITAIIGVASAPKLQNRYRRVRVESSARRINNGRDRYSAEDDGRDGWFPVERRINTKKEKNRSPPPLRSRTDDVAIGYAVIFGLVYSAHFSFRSCCCIVKHSARVL